MGKPFIAIKIIHDIKNRLVYNLYAEFFRLFGIYIGEGYADEYSEQDYEEDFKCFNAFLCINTEETGGSIFVQKKYENGEIIRINAESYSFPNGMDTEEDGVKEALQKKMEIVLSEVAEMSGKRGYLFPFSLMREGVPFYLECNVMRAAMLLQYYRRPLDCHKNSQKSFQRILECLDNIKRSEKYKEFQNESWYMEYARIYCKQKVNLSCYYQENGILEYEIDELIAECEKLIESRTEFSNTKVLLGMICDKSDRHRHYAAQSYLEAIRQEGNMCYAAHIYYWIGLLYESHVECREDAQKAYDMAYKLKKKYRNIYKKARMSGKEKDFEQEVHYYKECLENLEKRIPLCMDPLEAEYYFKTGVLTCVDCTAYLDRYEEAVEIGEKVLKFYEEYYEKDSYKDFLYFFGKDAQKYRNISLRRIRCQKVYEGLSVAYRELGNKERSKYYKNLAG